jgi:hypothetical protein
LDDFKAGISRIGVTLKDFERILDFGCGCGRVKRWLAREIPPERISGAGIDAPAVPAARPHRQLRPSPHALRMTKRSISSCRTASFLTTVHAPTNWTDTRDKCFSCLNVDTATMERELLECGLLYWAGGWDAHFPQFYHTAWHTTAYLRQHWSRWFEVVEIIEGGGRPTQDLVVLRRQ